MNRRRRCGGCSGRVKAEPRVSVKQRKIHRGDVALQVTAAYVCKMKYISTLGFRKYILIPKRNPVLLFLSFLLLLQISFLKWKLLPHLAQHLAHIPSSDLLNVSGSGSPQLLPISLLIQSYSLSSPSSVYHHFPRFLYWLPIYIGDRKWPGQIEQLLSCWG